MQNQTQQKQGTRKEPPPSQMRRDALLKLIQVEPDHFSSLVQTTGWGEEQIRMTLLQLTVDGLVRRHNRAERKYFSAIKRSDTHEVSHI